MVSFAWMRRTAFGDGTWENDSRGGLTRLGRQAIAEMNRLGIIADISHASDQTTWDILGASQGPVIASHSNARAIHDHPRNLTDEMIRAIAASGGVIGIVAVAGYIADGEATIANWADHLDHIVNLVGIDHAAVGCDFYDEIATMGAAHDIPAWGPPGGLGQLTVSGMTTWADLPGLTAELVRRGYGEAELRKVYGGNFLRVLTGVCGA
jgi:membrane dipeptidase